MTSLQLYLQERRATFFIGIFFCFCCRCCGASASESDLQQAYIVIPPEVAFTRPHNMRPIYIYYGMIFHVESIPQVSRFIPERLSARQLADSPEELHHHQRKAVTALLTVSDFEPSRARRPGAQTAPLKRFRKTKKIETSELP